MKTKKKSRFLTFCFSLLPGAGEMYMGFMRTGVSLMLLFFLSIYIPVSLRLSELSVIGFVVWAYGFFHANHLASLGDEEFDQVEDGFLFGMETITDGKNFIIKYQRTVAVLLIAAGILLLWNTMGDIAYRLLPKFVSEFMRTVGRYAPRILVSLVNIFNGIKMIEGRKAQLSQIQDQRENEEGFDYEPKERKQTVVEADSVTMQDAEQTDGKE